jgi:hypothetical protein
MISGQGLQKRGPSALAAYGEEIDVLPPELRESERAWSAQPDDREGKQDDNASNSNLSKGGHNSAVQTGELVPCDTISSVVPNLIQYHCSFPYR